MSPTTSFTCNITETNHTVQHTTQQLARSRWRWNTSMAIAATALCCCIVLQTTEARSLGATANAEHRRRYCGDALADVVAIVCNGRYHDPYSQHVRRSRDTSAASTHQGIVEECCRRSCSRRTIAMYCEEGTVGDLTSGSSESQITASPLRSNSIEEEGPKPVRNEIRHQPAILDKSTNNEEDKDMKMEVDSNKPSPGFEIGTISPILLNRPAFIPGRRIVDYRNIKPYSN